MNAWQTLQYRTAHALARRLIRNDAAGLRRIAARLGTLLWHGLPTRRRLAIRTIAERLELPEAEATQIARRSFEHNALSFLEITLAPRFGLDRPDLRVPAADMLAEVRALNRPIVCTTAHLGAWELCAGLIGDYMPADRPSLIIVRNHDNPAIRQFMADMRGSRGGEVIGHRNAAFSILKGLRRNGMAGFLVDHNTSTDEAVFLPFLGKVAAVNVGPAMLAVRSHALILPVMVVRDGDTYVLHIEPPLDTACLEGETPDRVHAAASFYTQAVERSVRAWPDQWFWMHKRWKTRPPDEQNGIEN